MFKTKTLEFLNKQYKFRKYITSRQWSDRIRDPEPFSPFLRAIFDLSNKIALSLTQLDLAQLNSTQLDSAPLSLTQLDLA